MEYAHYDHPQFESMFPAANTGHQLSPTVPMDQSQAFYPIDSAPFSSTYEVFDERQGFSGYGMTNVEGVVDASKGPRLTQEQLARLEEEFAENYKPNTDHKKALAESMGVEYPKVNNWFQNRRAKAKQECQAQQRSDRSHQESAPPFGTAPLDYRRISDSQNSAPFFSQEQRMLELMKPPIDFDCLDDIPEYLVRQDVPDGQSYHTSPLQLDLSAVAGDAYTQWPGNQLYGDHKIPTASVREINSQETVSAPVSIPTSCIDAGQGNAEWHHPPMYNNFVGGNLIGNPSSHSFGTSPSEEGEQTNYITPPLEASPLPGFNQSNIHHDRQASNSSDLAENLGTVHIQQSQADLGIDGTYDAAPASNMNTTTGLLTPEISPDTMVSKLPFVAGHDIASRRKRPRPAALQPESNRSVSYAGPMTTSPRLRISPPGSGKLSPVRRIKSTGNNLNVMTGRVKKAGTATAQISPRNLESCFRLASKTGSQQHSDHHVNSPPTSGANGNSLIAPSPQSFPVLRQGTRPTSPPNSLPSSTRYEGVNDNVSYTHTLPEPGWAPNPADHTNLNLAIPHPQSNHSHHYVHNYPPQSAPSHVTNFDAAAGSVSENVGSGWILPSSMQHEPYRDDTQLSMPLRPNHFQHSHSDPFNYYQASIHPFQPYGPSMGVYMPYPPFPPRSPTPPFKSLDIKVETGPPPPKEMAQASQERKEYTFENSFAGDAHFTTGSKK